MWWYGFFVPCGCATASLAPRLCLAQRCAATATLVLATVVVAARWSCCAVMRGLRRGVVRRTNGQAAACQMRVFGRNAPVTLAWRCSGLLVQTDTSNLKNVGPMCLGDILRWLDPSDGSVEPLKIPAEPETTSPALAASLPRRAHARRSEISVDHPPPTRMCC